MHGLILAGGDGSRLLADGVREPKAAVAIGGRPQVVRLVEMLTALGCESVTCMAREDLAPTIEGLCRDAAVAAVVVPCRTPSSLHTLAEGFRRLAPGPAFCSMVDTVMRADDWRMVHDAATRHLAAGADAVLAVTSYVDDESPLWVDRDPADPRGRVRVVGSAPVRPPCVTGGVYAFAPAARLEAQSMAARGVHRMRAFLSGLVSAGAVVTTVEVERIVDVDRKHDLDLANAWLAPDAPQVVPTAGASAQSEWAVKPV